MAKIRPSYCQDCKKRTYLTEEAAQQRVRDTLTLLGVFLSVYRCPARIYGFHVRNIEKRLARRGKDGERSKLKREYTILIGELLRAKDQNQKVTPTAEVTAQRALDGYLRRMPPTPSRERHNFEKFRRAHVRYRRQRDTARVGLPRGELVTRMIGYWRGGSYDLRDQHPRHGNGDLLRRRNRARENEAVRREIDREADPYYRFVVIEGLDGFDEME